MVSSTQARRVGSRGTRGFTLLAILVVLAALTLVVGMALQRGEDERRSAILVRHDAIALSAAEFGLDRSRAYLGAILDKEGDLDKALDPLMNTNCVSLLNLNSDAGTDDDNLPVIDGGAKVAYGGLDRPFLLVPYNADGDTDDGGTAEGAYLIRFDDNDDDGLGPSLKNTTSNNVGAFDCREGVAMNAYPARTNTARDRDRSIFVTVVGISPGTDVTRAQARKVLRARLGTAPAAGLITGGTIDMQGAAHICGAYGNVAVSDGGFEDGCVCGKACTKGPPDQSCGEGNVCNVMASSSVCHSDFGNTGGNCIGGAAVPPAPKVEVWSKLNAPPKCTTVPCTPFYYLRADKYTVAGVAGPLGSDKAQVFMWDYAVCPDPQAFSRIHYPGEPNSAEWPILTKGAPVGGCWKLVYDGNSGCPGDVVRMADDLSLTNLTPSLTTSCTATTTPIVWTMNATTDATTVGSCDNSDTVYPDVGAKRYLRDHVTGGSVTYSSGSRIPRGVWLVDGKLSFTASTPAIYPPITPQIEPVTLLVTGDVLVENNSTVSLSPAHREVALMTGRDLVLRGGNSFLYTCGDPSMLPAAAMCPSAAIMVYEQFSMGNNTHLQGQLVVQNAGFCSGAVPDLKAVQLNGNATISVPGVPPIISPGGATVLSWGEGSF